MRKDLGIENDLFVPVLWFGRISLLLLVASSILVGSFIAQEAFDILLPQTVFSMLVGLTIIAVVFAVISAVLWKSASANYHEYVKRGIESFDQYLKAIAFVLEQIKEKPSFYKSGEEARSAIRSVNGTQSQHCLYKGHEVAKATDDILSWMKEKKYYDGGFTDEGLSEFQVQLLQLKSLVLRLKVEYVKLLPHL